MSEICPTQPNNTVYALPSHPSTVTTVLAVSDGAVRFLFLLDFCGGGVWNNDLRFGGILENTEKREINH
jgi:hypothetical protein